MTGPGENINKQLQAENERLKKLIGELTIVNDAFKNIGDRKEDKLAVVHLMIDEHNHDGLSLRKALAYTDCSRNFYYHHKKKRLRIERCQQQDQTVLEKLRR